MQVGTTGKELVKLLQKRGNNMSRAINIIFDGPPDHDAGRFVEVETDDGKSINVGEWIKREEGVWVLRITELPKKQG